MGAVEPKNLPHGAVTAKERADSMFDRLDTNADGEVTREEFVKGLTSDPELRGLLNSV